MLALLIAQMPIQPRDMEGVQRAALIAREHPGLTQEEIAQRAGVTRQSLGRWMSAAPQVFQAA